MCAMGTDLQRALKLLAGLGVCSHLPQKSTSNPLNGHRATPRQLFTSLPNRDTRWRLSRRSGRPWWGSRSRPMVSNPCAPLIIDGLCESLALGRAMSQDNVLLHTVISPREYRGPCICVPGTMRNIMPSVAINVVTFFYAVVAITVCHVRPCCSSYPVCHIHLCCMHILFDAFIYAVEVAILFVTSIYVVVAINTCHILLCCSTHPVCHIRLCVVVILFTFIYAVAAILFATSIYAVVAINVCHSIYAVVAILFVTSIYAVGPINVCHINLCRTPDVGIETLSFWRQSH